MEKQGARYVLAFCVSVVAGIVLQCLYGQWGGPVLATLVPVNASAWEQGKLCFWPYLAGALLIWRLGDGTDSRGGHCALMLLMPFLLTLSCAALGERAQQLLPVLWPAVTALGITLYAWVLRRRLWGGELLWYTLAILLGIAYLLLTAMPPQTGIFTDPMGLPTVAIPV